MTWYTLRAVDVFTVFGRFQYKVTYCDMEDQCIVTSADSQTPTQAAREELEDHEEQEK